MAEDVSNEEEGEQYGEDGTAQTVDPIGEDVQHP